MLTEVTDDTFDDVVLGNNGIVIVDFWAPWCGPCKVLMPTVEELSTEITSATFVKVNVQDNEIKAQEFGVKALPTLMLFKDGALISARPGGGNKAAIAEWIKNNS